MRYITLAAADGAHDLAESLELLRRLRTELTPLLPDELLAYLATQARFIVSVARQYQGRGVAWPQLLEAGQRGLIKAWEVNLGNQARLDELSAWWVRQSISDTCASYSH